MTNLKGKNIVVGVTGGIAAYKSCEVVSQLVKAGAVVRVIMTQNATRFVAPMTFETLSGNRVITDMWERNFEWNVAHVSLAKTADIVVIAPCTANFASKYANGLADDFLSTFVQAVTCPVILAPAMNVNMLKSAAYQKNAAVLAERGVLFVACGKGRLACGDEGEGRMAEPQDIVEKLVELLSKKKDDLTGKTILITAGGTREQIDPVRFISNYSSGKMGAALATAAAARGAKVIFVHGSISVPVDHAWQTVPVTSTQDMHDAVAKLYKDADIIIKAAAPADYGVDKAAQKIKDNKVSLTLTKNPDIAAYIGKNKGNKKLIIFAAETENLIDNAKKKLVSKNADLVVANDITQQGAGFDVDTNIVSLVSKDAVVSLDKMSKRELADVILDSFKED